MKAKPRLLFAIFSVLALLGTIGIASATVQPTLAINQSNDFISQYSEMNFSISEYSGQKSLNYFNLTIPSGYLLSIPNITGSQVGMWNSSQPITVVTPTDLSIGSIGNISVVGNLMSIHLFAGDNPFAVNTNDSTVILSLYPFTWQNPSTQGVKIWNYSMNIAGDPQLYTAFTFTVIRDYTSVINSNFTSNNQYISCTANVTLNNNNSLGVNVNLTALVNNTNINVQNISIQTYLNNSNYFNWSFVFDTNNTVNVQTYSINNISQVVNFSIDLSNNNSVLITNLNNNSVITTVINNNSVNNVVTCGSNSSAMQTFNASFDFSNTNNSISVLNYFNGTNVLNASFWLSNNNSLLVTNYNNNTNWVDCSNNNTIAIVTYSNATATLNATFDVSNNNSINVLMAFNGTNSFNASFDLSNNNSVFVSNINNNTVITTILNNNSVYNNINCGSNSSAAVMNYFNGTVDFNASFLVWNNNSINNFVSCDSNSSAYISAQFNNTNIYNASMSFWSNLTNYFNASFALTNNNSILIDANWNNTNYNLFNASFSLSNNNTWMLTNINNNTNYIINNITNINNATLICDPVNINNGSSYDAPTYLTSNSTVNIPSGFCPAAPAVSCTSSCPNMSTGTSGPLGGYSTPIAAGIITLGLLASTLVYLRKFNIPKKPETVSMPPPKKKTGNQLIDEGEINADADTKQELGEKPKDGGIQDSQLDTRIG